MPTLFQAVQGFAGASGVGMLCLTGVFLIVSVFATNLPTVTAKLVADTNWSAIVSLPVLVTAYVIGLIAIASIEASSGFGHSNLQALRDTAIASSYGKLEQEAEILSGSVVGFALLGIAAVANTWPWPGWTRTLMFTAMVCWAVSYLAWKMALAKHGAAAQILRDVSASSSAKPLRPSSGVMTPTN